jgi:hypothetical protein
VDAAAVTGCVELANRAAQAVRALNREDVAVVGKAAVVAGDPGRGWRGEGGEEERKGERESGALQWCSITRSTMLYSFASGALMK